MAISKLYSYLIEKKKQELVTVQHNLHKAIMVYILN
jgi:hypothetical protein